jgi:aminoglycoside phosphotransferase (APT) family kinase protein
VIMDDAPALTEPLTDTSIGEGETSPPSPLAMPESSEAPGESTALHEYVRNAILPQLAPPPYGEIEIERLCRQKPVYLFTERRQNAMAVGKLFEKRLIPTEKAWMLAETEYSNLRTLRDAFGMDSGAYQVVAPLGKKQELCALLVTEKASGNTLDYYIAKAVYQQESQRLLDKLGYLARFFAKLHRNSETTRQINPDLSQCYLEGLLECLSETTMTSVDVRTVEECALQWWGNGSSTTDTEVMVHGDATPTNFLFHHQDVVGVDLERMTCSDRCWDLGFVAAELKHHFMWRSGNGWAAEPFIGHFLSEYAEDYGNSQFFHDTTRRLPFFMALGLLRIARNSWLGEQYRKDLVTEALRCLKYAP